MEFTHRLQLDLQFWDERLWKWNGPVFVAFAVYRQNPILEIEILHSKTEAFKEAKPTAIEQVDYKIKWIIQMFHNRVNFLPRKNNGYILGFFCTRYIALISKSRKYRSHFL